MESRTTFSLEVNPRIPRRLARLEELASNLWYSWDRPARTLFSRLHTGLWDAVGHNRSCSLAPPGGSEPMGLPTAKCSSRTSSVCTAASSSQTPAACRQISV